MKIKKYFKICWDSLVLLIISQQIYWPMTNKPTKKLAVREQFEIDDVNFFADSGSFPDACDYFDFFDSGESGAAAASD